jgi:signal transduction histidine kinase
VDAGRYLLSVEDHGRGMTATQIADVGAYLQFDRRRHQQRGAGLGLSIVKALAELQGGGLRIVSDPGRQTVATVILPLTRSAATAPTTGILE